MKSVMALFLAVLGLSAVAGDKNMSSDKDIYKDKLSPEQYRICRMGGTEAPGSGKYYKYSAKGTYICAACGQELFASETKFDSGTGWPSFTDAKNSKNVKLLEDNSHGMHRIEVQCSRCGSHLGHVFDDGPAPTGKRWCINSLALDFKPAP